MSMLTFATVSAVLVALCSADTFAPSQFSTAPQFNTAPQFRSQFSQQPIIAQTGHIPVLSRTEERHDDGNFNYKYQTGDGQSVQESGVTKRNHENDGNVIVKQGSYSFTSPEGVQYTVQYTADEYGFHPVASHLPASVPVPPVRF